MSPNIKFQIKNYSFRIRVGTVHNPTDKVCNTNEILRIQALEIQFKFFEIKINLKIRMDIVRYNIRKRVIPIDILNTNLKF